jgi:FkbM family methyltransferase
VFKVSRIKPYLGKLVNKSINRPRFNDSRIYYTYVALRYPEHARSKKAEIQFYHHALGDSAHLVFDVGANGGAKTAIFANLANEVVSIEPNPFAVTVLRQRFSNNPTVKIIAAGVGDHEGMARLNIFGEGDAYNTFSDKWVATLGGLCASAQQRPIKAVVDVAEIPVTTVDALIKANGVPDYIKVDVEGYELQVMKGLTRPVPLISFECNLPEFKEETMAIIRLLSAGSPKGIYNFTTGEPPIAFESPTWLQADDIIGVVGSGRFGFLEIYFRSAP